MFELKVLMAFLISILNQKHYHCRTEQESQMIEFGSRQQIRKIRAP